ncbi:MAG: hypothetical protein AB1627_14995 [Chloroflexota bacterium]
MIMRRIGELFGRGRPVWKARVVGHGPRMARHYITKSRQGGRCEQLDGVVAFEHVTWRDVDLSGLVFDYFGAMGSTFERCDFTRTEFRSGGLGHDGSRYVDCLFDRSDLRHVFPLGATFERCRFDRARLEGWRPDKASFIECTFVGPIRNVMFYGAEVMPDLPGRGRNAFRGNDFRQATITDSSFGAGIDIGANTMPEGDEYVILDRWPERAALGLAELRSRPKSSERDEMIIWLEIMATGVYAEQQILFARRVEPGMVPATIQNAVWDLVADVL